MSFVNPPSVGAVLNTAGPREPAPRQPLRTRTPRLRAGDSYPRARGTRGVCRIPAGAPQQGCSPGPKMGGKSWPRLPGQFVRCDMPERRRATSTVTQGAPINFLKPPMVNWDYGYDYGTTGMLLDPKYYGGYGMGAVSGPNGDTDEGDEGDTDDYDDLVEPSTPPPLDQAAILAELARQQLADEAAAADAAAAEEPGVLAKIFPWAAGLATGFFILPRVFGK